MAIFKKAKAVYVEKMNQVSKVTITEETVKFNIGWSDHTFKPEEIPGLVADLIQIYGIVKPAIDKRSEEAESNKTDEQKNDPSNEPIDLSEIPF